MLTYIAITAAAGLVLSLFGMLVGSCIGFGTGDDTSDKD